MSSEVTEGASLDHDSRATMISARVCQHLAPREPDVPCRQADWAALQARRHRPDGRHPAARRLGLVVDGRLRQRGARVGDRRGALDVPRAAALLGALGRSSPQAQRQAQSTDPQRLRPAGVAHAGAQRALSRRPARDTPHIRLHRALGPRRLDARWRSGADRRHDAQRPLRHGRRPELALRARRRQPLP